MRNLCLLTPLHVTLPLSRSEATEALEGFFFPEEPDFIIRLHYITSLHL